MTDPYLLLWLEAPIQSWGHDSKFGRRDSLGFPTKSGVLGLLCCALGAAGEQQELLSKFSELDMSVLAYARKGFYGGPEPSEPLLCDFHMVGSGYDNSDPWESLLIPKTNAGKKAVGGGTKITYRYYLQDMAFGVAMQVPAEQIERLADALQNPVWDLFLGRKCCVPTELIYQGQYADVEELLVAAEKLATQKNRMVSYQVKQGEYEGEVLTLNDVPVQFGKRKRYRDRRVTIQT